MCLLFDKDNYYALIHFFLNFRWVLRTIFQNKTMGRIGKRI